MGFCDQSFPLPGAVLLFVQPCARENAGCFFKLLTLARMPHNRYHNLISGMNAKAASYFRENEGCFPAKMEKLIRYTNKRNFLSDSKVNINIENDLYSIREATSESVTDRLNSFITILILSDS